MSTFLNGLSFGDKVALATLYNRCQCLLRKNKAVMERESALVREWKQIPLDKFGDEIYTDINMIERNAEVEIWTFMM